MLLLPVDTAVDARRPIVHTASPERAEDRFQQHNPSPTLVPWISPSHNSKWSSTKAPRTQPTTLAPPPSSPTACPEDSVVLADYTTSIHTPKTPMTELQTPSELSLSSRPMDLLILAFVLQPGPDSAPYAR